jgi:hypothetical protein
MVKRNAWFLLQLGSANLIMVPRMRRLLSPVNAGMSAARHVLWYLSYHAGPRQR